MNQREEVILNGANLLLTLAMEAIAAARRSRAVIDTARAQNRPPTNEELNEAERLMEVEGLNLDAAIEAKRSRDAAKALGR